MVIIRYCLLCFLFELFIVQDVFAATINFGSNGCTLQDAIHSANNDTSVGNCSSGSGTDVLIAPDVWIKTINSVLPTITSDMTITTATNSGLLEINGNGHRIFKIIGTSTDITLARVYLHHGGATSAIDGGGAMRIIDASVSLQDSYLYDNDSYVGKGGAIFIDDGDLNINQTVFLHNNAFKTAQFNGITYGGAIYAKDSNLTIAQTSFLENSSQYGLSAQILDFIHIGVAASIYMDSGDLIISESLFNENYTGILAEGVIATISNSTFNRKLSNPYPDRSLIDFRDFSALTLNHNTLKTPVQVQDSILNMTNTILYGECRLSINVDWIINSGNIYNTDRFNCDGGLFDRPRLLDLSDNGGSTVTFGLHHLSDAIDAGDPAYCLPTDQRGENRGILCDIGAFEVTGFADIEVSGSFLQNLPYVSAQEVLYTITVKNNGPAIATDVEVDINTNHIFVTGIDTSLCASFPCVLSSIQPNQEVIIPVSLTMGNHLNSPFELTASALATTSSLYTDVDLGNNSTVTINEPINQGADMAVNMNLLTSAPYFVGQALTYEATITNHGQQTASNVVLEFIPSGLNNIIFQNCNSTVGQTCSYQNMLNNGTGTIIIKADITASSFDATAEISSSLIDINSSNNIDEIGNNGAVTQANIEITTDINQLAPYYAYQYLEFNVYISTGNTPASNIHVFSDFPDAEYIGASGCGFPCVIPSMAANSMQTITLQYFAPTEVDAMNNSFTHHIVVTPAQTDPDMSNNEVTIVQPLVPAADVAVDLTLSTLGPFTVGQTVQYQLRVVNAGVSHASNVDIGLIPDNLTLLWAVSDNCTTVDCNLTNLDRFHEENLTLAYTINGPELFDLMATVEANELDIFPNNNTDDSGNDGNAVLIQGELMLVDGFE